MAVPAMTNNSPAAGHISWELFHIQYQGVGYEVAAGSTDQRWVWWRFNAGVPVVETGSVIPANMTDDDLLLFANKNGIALRIQASNFIDGEMIVDGTILADAIAVNQISSGHIVTMGLDASVIKFGTMSGQRIEADTITADQIASRTITALEIAANTLTANEIAANAITADEIAANAVTADEIAANAVTANEIAAGAITAEKIAAGQISTKHLSIGGNNLVMDSSFESASLFNHSITNNAVFSPSFDSVVKRSGTKSLKHTVLTGVVNAQTTIVLNGPLSVPDNHPRVKPGEVWKATIWARANPSSIMNLSLSAVFRKFSTPTVAYSQTDGSASLLQDSWQAYTVEGVYPEDAGEDGYVAIQVMVGNSSVGDVVYYDDAELVKKYEGALIVDGSILAKHISTGAITASKVAAGAITAESLAADAVTSTHLSGKYITGVTLDITGSLYAESGYLEVKADLLEAQSAIFHNNVTRRGANNFIEGRETASAGVTDPGTPPTVTNAWPYVTLQFVAPVENLRQMHDDYLTRELMVYGSLNSIAVYDTDTGVKKRDILLGDFWEDGLAMCRFKDWYYAALVPSGSNRVVIRRYSALLANEGEQDVAWGELDYMSANALGNELGMVIAGHEDVTPNEIVGIHVNTNGEYRIRTFNAETKATISTYQTLPGPLPGINTTLVGLDVWTGVGTTIRLQPGSKPMAQWNRSSGGVLSVVDMSRRALPYGETLGAASASLTLDGHGRLYLHTSGSEDLTNYTNLPYTYTWYDSDPLGLGTAESLPSPARNFTPAKGAYVNMRTPLPPDDGTSDAPNTIKFYVNNSLQAGISGGGSPPPEYTETELAEGRTRLPNLGGSAPPAVSGFATRLSTLPGGYKSTKGDAIGPYWSLYGDGSVRMGAFTVTSLGKTSYGPYFMGSPSDPLVATSTFVKLVDFNTPEEIGYSRASGVITFLTPGRYAVIFNCGFSGHATGDRVARVTKNGVLWGQDRRPSAGGGGTRTIPSFVQEGRFAAGDTLEFQAWQNSGVGLAVEALYSSASIRFIGS